ncbi:hypothetical protein E2C01_045366 [Portunus trituberculatus]|uniref:Uncharacterized protein n=1 Tax=Portunus trituberculatus TaxID=210409 RepID=A0A5B7G303_PORTR|nr:hypothetical protein [Portunus trituberculatus]
MAARFRDSRWTKQPPPPANRSVAHIQACVVKTYFQLPQQHSYPLGDPDLEFCVGHHLLHGQWLPVERVYLIGKQVACDGLPINCQLRKK